MTQQKQTLTKQKEAKSTARKQAYISCLERYPLYSTLLVLDEYEGKELYEECAVIKKALDEYNNTKVNIETVNKLTGPLIFPTRLEEYKEGKFQKILQDYNIIVEEKSAKEKATLIKLKLPVK